MKLILEFSITEAVQFIAGFRDDTEAVKAIQDLGARLVGPTENLRATLEKVPVPPPPPAVPPTAPPIPPSGRGEL